MCLIAHHLQEEMFEDLMDISVLELKEEREFQRAKKRKKTAVDKVQLKSIEEKFLKHYRKEKEHKSRCSHHIEEFSTVTPNVRRQREFQGNNLEHRISCPAQTLKYEDLIKTFSCIQGLKN